MQGKNDEPKGQRDHERGAGAGMLTIRWSACTCSRASQKTASHALQEAATTPPPNSTARDLPVKSIWAGTGPVMLPMCLGRAGRWDAR